MPGSVVNVFHILFSKLSKVQMRKPELECLMLNYHAIYCLNKTQYNIWIHSLWRWQECTYFFFSFSCNSHSKWAFLASQFAGNLSLLSSSTTSWWFNFRASFYHQDTKFVSRGMETNPNKCYLSCMVGHPKWTSGFYPERKGATGEVCVRVCLYWRDFM